MPSESELMEAFASLPDDFKPAGVKAGWLKDPNELAALKRALAERKKLDPDAPREIALPTRYGLTDVEIIGENDHGYQFGVGKLGIQWQAFAVGKTEDGMMAFYFPELLELGMNNRETTIQFAGAFASDPENAYGGIPRWFVPEKLQCTDPDGFKCQDCGSYECEEH